MQGGEIRRDWGDWGLDAENKSFGLNVRCARLNCWAWTDRTEGHGGGVGVIPGLVKPGILKSLGMTMVMGEEAGIRVFMILHCPFLIIVMLLWEALGKP